MLKFVKNHMETITGIEIYPHDIVTYNILYFFCSAFLVGIYSKKRIHQ